MRLIDADLLKLRKVYCHERHEWAVPVDEIDWMPTAYDMDKVVSLLESKKNGRFAEMFGRKNTTSLCAGYVQGYQDSIDIVKKGGVDEM